MCPEDALSEEVDVPLLLQLRRRRSLGISLGFGLGLYRAIGRAIIRSIHPSVRRTNGNPDERAGERSLPKAATPSGVSLKNSRTAEQHALIHSLDFG